MNKDIKTLSDVNKNIGDRKKEKISNSIVNISEEMDNNMVTGVIPETVFVEHFLDYFKSGGSETDNPVLSNKWREIAGGPYNEVKVLDKNGDELFTTPGLFNKPVVSPAVSNIDFSEMTKTFQNKTNRMASEGENYLSQQLNAISKGITIEDNNDNVVRWKKIVKRYDNVTDVNPTTATSKMKSLIGGDDDTSFLDI